MLGEGLQIDAFVIQELDGDGASQSENPHFVGIQYLTIDFVEIEIPTQEYHFIGQFQRLLLSLMGRCYMLSGQRCLLHNVVVLCDMCCSGIDLIATVVDVDFILHGC